MILQLRPHRKRRLINQLVSASLARVENLSSSNECVVFDKRYLHTPNTCAPIFDCLSVSSLIAAISTHRSRQSHDVSVANEENSLSGTPRSLAQNRGRPIPASYAYWVNTGDNNQNHASASFMRSTYAATCRSRLSRSVERCPRACRGIRSHLPACLT